MIFAIGARVFWKRPDDDSAQLFFAVCIVTVGAFMGGYHWTEIVTQPWLIYPFALFALFVPVVNLHFFLIWLLSRWVSDLGTLYNLYYLLTYPLTACTAMLALRRLGLTFPAAAVGAVLYAFLPGHYLRGEAHYFLAAYWMIPLSLLPVLRICAGNFPFYGRGAL